MVSWHLITSEYPPQPGGVSDYSFLVASALAAEGDEVHVWCPPAIEPAPSVPGVVVHREMGSFAPGDLARAGRRLDAFPGPRRLLVQWVPHGFGYRSMNLAFSAWLYRRAGRGDQIDLVMHETFLAFAGTWRQRAAALVHRAMVTGALAAASRVWTSTPSAIRDIRLYGRRGRQARWLPVPSNIPCLPAQEIVQAIRARHSLDASPVIGHFGTFGGPIAELLQAVLPRVLRAEAGSRALLFGRGSGKFRSRLIESWPDLGSRVHATGGLSSAEVSAHLQACDVLLQPYPEGITTRRGSAMAGLSHGCAMISTRGPLTEPVWVESGAVELAAVGSTDELVSRTLALLGDPARRAARSQAARELYGRAFALEHTVAALRGAYRDPAASPAGAPAEGA